MTSKTRERILEKRQAKANQDQLAWIADSLVRLATASGVELAPSPIQQSSWVQGMNLDDGVDDKEAATAGKALQKRRKPKASKET